MKSWYGGSHLNLTASVRLSLQPHLILIFFLIFVFIFFMLVGSPGKYKEYKYYARLGYLRDFESVLLLRAGLTSQSLLLEILTFMRMRRGEGG